MKQRLLPLLLAAALGLPGALRGEEALVAVATNFLATAQALAPLFEAQSGHRLVFSSGATGRLYAQITHGAGYDILLAADQARPARLEAEGRVVAGSRFSYAIGELVLWSADPARIGPDGPAAIAGLDYAHFAIANPDLAPYGLAARQALDALGLWPAVRDRLVMGQNVGQTFSLIATGNAEIGLVAKSLALAAPAPGSIWEVPASAHDPVRQDAVLLSHGAGNPAATAFLAFLKSDPARALIAAHGYAVEPAQ